MAVKPKAPSKKTAPENLEGDDGVSAKLMPPLKPGSAAAKAAAAKRGDEPEKPQKGLQSPLWKQLEGHQLSLKPLLHAHASNKLAGTLLFAGPSGIGKKFGALTLAQALVCEVALSDRPDGAGCGVCGPCIRIANRQSESLLIVEPDGAQIKVEQARDVLQFITLQKLGRARIVIIDQAHLLGPQSGNALLKSLEEPPAVTYFILVSHLPNTILATLRSRSQLVRFKPLSEASISKIIGSNDEWLLKAANGSVEQAKRMNEERGDYETLETATTEFLVQALDHFPGEQISALRELLKDRSTHGFVASIMQRQITEAMKLKSGIKVKPTKLVKELSEKSSLDRLAKKSLEFEADLARNVDRGLLLEAFAVELGR
jgi:DNA polymerase-3 subunit delta'